jgi:hypothetical protein
VYYLADNSSLSGTSWSCTNATADFVNATWVVVEPVREQTIYAVVLEYPASTVSAVPKSVKLQQWSTPMTWGFLDWCLMLAIIFLVAKLAKRTTWRTLFRPLKKETKEIKKEWEES